MSLKVQKRKVSDLEVKSRSLRIVAENFTNIPRVKGKHVGIQNQQMLDKNSSWKFEVKELKAKLQEGIENDA